MLIRSWGFPLVWKHSAPYFLMSCEISKENHVCKAGRDITGKRQGGS